MIYSEAILEHHRSPQNFGELDTADVKVREHNPLCGDEVTLYLAFDGEQLRDVRFTGRGCVLTMAAASMLTGQIRGQAVPALRQLGEAQLVALLGVEVQPVRMKCVNLALDALRRGLALHAERSGQGAGAEPARRHGLLDHVGGTPLVRLQAAAWGLPPRVQLFAKLEAMNPGGTAKARAVRWMIEDAMQAGRPPLRRSMAVLDVMSGSSGIALAMIGAQLGLATKLIVPAAVPDDTKRVLRAYGAQLHVLVDPSIGVEGATEIARETQRKQAERIYFLDAQHNPAARTAHYVTTGAEILAQLGAAPTHLVAGAGSGATLGGVGRRLKEHAPGVQVLAAVAAAGERIEGLRSAGGAGASDLDEGVRDGSLEVSLQEAEERTRQLAKQEGLLVGTSSGAALAASLRLAAQLAEGTIVTVFPDDGQRYLGAAHWLYD